MDGLAGRSDPAVRAGSNGTVLLGGWAPGGTANPTAAGALPHYPGQKVAVAYAPDATGRNALAGFLATDHGLHIVLRTVASGPTADSTAVRAAKTARAQVLVAFTTPGPATSGLASAMAESHWHIPLIAGASGVGQGLPDGTITDGFLPSTASLPKSPASTWITLFNQIRTRYLRGSSLSAAIISGMAAAYQLAATLFRVGPPSPDKACSSP